MMDKRIGERIKIARKAAGMTQDDLASLLGYKHKSSITKIEAGEMIASLSGSKEWMIIRLTSVRKK